MLHPKVENLTLEVESDALKKINIKHPNITIDILRLVIKLFLKYAIKSAVHGYSIYMKLCFRLKVKKRYWVDGAPFVTSGVSPKMFGMEFFLCFEDGYLQKYGYMYLQNESIKAELEKHLQTDIIYDIADEKSIY